MKSTQYRPANGNAQDVFSIARAGLDAAKNEGAMLATKDLARIMLVHPRTIKRWWKKLSVPPLIGGNGCHRWTCQQAQTLLNRWRDYSKKSGHVLNWKNDKATCQEGRRIKKLKNPPRSVEGKTRWKRNER